MLKKIIEIISIAFVLVVTLILIDLAVKSRNYKKKIPQSTVEVLKNMAKTNTNDDFGEFYLNNFKIRKFNEQGKIERFLKVKYGWKDKSRYFYMKDFLLLEFEYIKYSDKIKCSTYVGNIAKCDIKTGDVTIIGSYKKRTNYVEKEFIFKFLEKE